MRWTILLRTLGWSAEMEQWSAGVRCSGLVAGDGVSQNHRRLVVSKDIARSETAGSDTSSRMDRTPAAAVQSSSFVRTSVDRYSTWDHSYNAAPLEEEPPSDGTAQF